MPEGPAARGVGANAESMDAAEHSAMLERVMAGWHSAAIERAIRGLISS